MISIKITMNEWASKNKWAAIIQAMTEFGCVSVYDFCTSLIVEYSLCTERCHTVTDVSREA